MLEFEYVSDGVVDLGWGFLGMFVVVCWVRRRFVCVVILDVVEVFSCFGELW